MIGNAIYKPKGKAGEYAKYACNFYIGCSNDCTYCYCKRGLLGHAMGAPTPTLKKCFNDFMHATDIFRREVDDNLEELRKHGLFFTFTSDPCLKETWFLTWTSVDYAVDKGVPCMILTKRADIPKFPPQWSKPRFKDLIAFGFTLTGHDELEPGASTNTERIMKMKELHQLGFKTFASIEPIVTLDCSFQMIQYAAEYCDLFKIGLMSGKREYTKGQVEDFMRKVNSLIAAQDLLYGHKVKVYWKDSVLEWLGIDRKEMMSTVASCICVNANYNLFTRRHEE